MSGCIITAIESDLLARLDVVKAGKGGPLSEIYVHTFGSPAEVVDGVLKSEPFKSPAGFLTPPVSMSFPSDARLASPVQKLDTQFQYNLALVDTDYRTSKTRRDNLYGCHEKVLRSIKDQNFKVEDILGFERYQIEPYRFDSGLVFETREFVMLYYSFRVLVRNSAKAVL